MNVISGKLFPWQDTALKDDINYNVRIVGCVNEACRVIMKDSVRTFNRTYKETS